jgi:hypothetical protein
LGDEDLTGLGAEIPDLGFQELNLLARPAASHLQEAVDYGVEIDFGMVRHFEYPHRPQGKGAQITCMQLGVALRCSNEWQGYAERNVGLPGIQGMRHF